MVSLSSLRHSIFIAIPKVLNVFFENRCFDSECVSGRPEVPKSSQNGAKINPKIIKKTTKTHQKNNVEKTYRTICEKARNTTPKMEAKSIKICSGMPSSALFDVLVHIFMMFGPFGGTPGLVLALFGSVLASFSSIVSSI